MKKKLILCSALALCIFGISTTVKAESYIADTAPDSFVTNNAGGRLDINDVLVDDKQDAVMGNKPLADNSNQVQGGANNNVIDYHTSSATGYKKVFCIQRTKNYVPGGTYQRQTEVVPYAITYIIANAENYYNAIPKYTISCNTNLYKCTSPAVEQAKMEQSWFTQVAIWKYLNENNFTSINITDNDIIEDTHAYLYSSRAATLWTEADKLVTAAKQATDPSSITNLAFSYDGKNELDKDSKTVKTSIISLQTNGVTSYSVNLSSAPAGTKIYSQDGQEITDLNNVTATRFYLVMPIDNVDNYTYDFNITAKATGYTYYKGYKYTSEGNQPLVLVTKESKDLDASINIKGSNLEDTGLSVANSIYLIGFLILIAGIGVIYFNAKQKQEQI